MMLRRYLDVCMQTDHAGANELIQIPKTHTRTHGVALKICGNSGVCQRIDRHLHKDNYRTYITLNRCVYVR